MRKLTNRIVGTSSLRILTFCVAVLGLPVSFSSCKDSPADPGPEEAAIGCAGTPVSSETQRIMEGLRPTCEGCHLNGSHGFFASVDAFQQLLVSDPRLVVPGDPEGSELVRLLSGQGSGTFKQMPTGGPNYSQLVTAGAAKLSVEDIKAWISELSAQQRSPSPAADAPRITRVSAAQVQRTLYEQLGLGYSDFFSDALNYDIITANSIAGDDGYALQAPEMIPAPFVSNLKPQARFIALGGGSVILQSRPDPTVMPAFVQALSQLSQRWCRMAIAKNGKNNGVLFPQGGSLSADPVQIKATIKRWNLHFLSEQAADADVESLYTNLFAPLQKEAGSIEPAYVGTCSYFIRHPHWTFY